MTAAIYARVSTADQNCDMQLDELRAYAQRSGWPMLEYVDQGVSGMKRSRPALDKLMTDARLRKIDVVLVWKLDRFGRSLQNLMDSIFELDRLKVRFIALTQGIDTDQNSPMGRFILHLFGAIAEFERGMIVERVKAGVTAAKKRGKHCGRPKRVFRRDQALEMYAAGWSKRAIARALEVSEITIRRLLPRSADGDSLIQ